MRYPALLSGSRPMLERSPDTMRPVTETRTEPWWRVALRRYRRFNQKTSAWNDRWLFPVACMLMVAIAVGTFPQFLAAWHNEGTFGTFTAVAKDCGYRSG